QQDEQQHAVIDAAQQHVVEQVALKLPGLPEIDVEGESVGLLLIEAQVEVGMAVGWRGVRPGQFGRRQRATVERLAITERYGLPRGLLVAIVNRKMVEVTGFVVQDPAVP